MERISKIIKVILKSREVERKKSLNLKSRAIIQQKIKLQKDLQKQF